MPYIYVDSFLKRWHDMQKNHSNQMSKFSIDRMILIEMVFPVNKYKHSKLKILIYRLSRLYFKLDQQSILNSVLERNEYKKYTKRKFLFVMEREQSQTVHYFHSILEFLNKENQLFQGYFVLTLRFVKF